MPDKDRFNEWHNDPSNWKLGVFYFNPKDKRIFPPKRFKSFGWTVNFANPFSILTLILIIFIMISLGIKFGT